MNLEKTSIILKKINRLHDLINAIGEASSTETDLLKAYVIDLYEAVAMSDIAETKDLKKEEMEKKLKKQKKVEKKIKKKVVKKKVEEAVIEEEDEEEEDEEMIEEIEMEVKEAIKFAAENDDVEVASAAVEVEKEVIVESPQPKKSESTYSSELIELFDLHESSELSDKLANAPIKDLTKAMGINERIFTVNELFGGNQSEMTNILKALNGLNNFGEAKSVLMDSVAQKYNWTEGSKLKKAKNFIKLVKRRFNS